MIGGVFASLPSIASAQLPQSVVDQLTPKYRSQGPCRDPWITIAINDVFANTREIKGVGDAGECNKYLYNGGTWSNYAELYKAVKQSFDDQAAGRLQITKKALANGNFEIATSIVGRPEFTNTQIVSHDGGTLLTSDGAGLTISVVAQGGGNMIGNSGSTLVSTNGGNILSNNHGSVVGPGGASYKTLSINDNEAQVNLGRSVLVLRRPVPASSSGSSNSSGPGTKGGSSGSSDDQILICINNRSAVQAIKRMGGLSMTVSAGTVYYSGSVVNQFYKDRLVEAANSCGARAVNTDKLRVG
jgi:hypothetical protein